MLCIYLGGASGSLCNFDDFIGIDQGSLEGTGQGEDRFCGAKLLDHDFIICLYFSRYLSDFLMKIFFNNWIARSKPFQLKVRSNGDHFNNAFNSQTGKKPKLLFNSIVNINLIDFDKYWFDRLFVALHTIALCYINSTDFLFKPNLINFFIWFLFIYNLYYNFNTVAINHL